MITTTPALFGSLCVDQSSFKIASKFFTHFHGLLDFITFFLGGKALPASWAIF